MGIELEERYIETNELASLRNFCRMPVTPYQVGFEHMRYCRIYDNPYVAGTAEWRQYIFGHTDARKETAAAA